MAMPPWTFEEDKSFELAVLQVEETAPDRWQRVAAALGGARPAEELLERYRLYVLEVQALESDGAPLPPYRNSHFIVGAMGAAVAGPGAAGPGPAVAVAPEASASAPATRGSERPRRLSASAGGPVAAVAAAGGAGTSASGGSEDRRKGVPWSEDEHRMFLAGLKRFGKGDWRSIARSFVPTRTPSQVASHAQKYFIRQRLVNKDNKRRPSIHDITSPTAPTPPPGGPQSTGGSRRATLPTGTPELTVVGTAVGVEGSPSLQPLATPSPQLGTMSNSSLSPRSGQPGYRRKREGLRINVPQGQSESLVQPLSSDEPSARRARRE